MSDIERKISSTILSKTFKNIKENPLTNIGCTVGLVNEDDIYNWKCTLIGPNDSPYKGGFFQIYLKFPYNYPQEGPEVIFKTPIFHLNVNPVNLKDQELGHCCVSVVNFWNPDTSIEDLLVAIFALFYQANAESAYHGYSEEDINEFIKNKRNYNKKVAYFTEKYANGQYKPPKDLTKWDFTMG